MDGELFADLVRIYLRTSGLTQKQLAIAVGLHPHVLSRKFHNDKTRLNERDIRNILLQLARMQAIHTRADAEQLLAAVEQPPSFLSEAEWNAMALEPLAPTRPVPLVSSREPIFNARTGLHNFPAQTTRLVGRAMELAHLQQLCLREEVRLINLVGSGGSGKTRLALALASTQVSAHPDGVWFVPLSGVTDVRQVPLVMLQVLQIQAPPGISLLEHLMNYVRDKQMLLLLDNFEHLAAASHVIADLLAAAPALKIVVTSRAVLHIYGEHEVLVTSLDLPDAAQEVLSCEQLLSYGAIQLFMERAQAVLPSFALHAENATTIMQICHKVGGLPLALELAAPRVRLFPPAQLLELLSQAILPVLTGGAKNLPDRHQTLRKTIAWSYELLSVTEKRCFRRLGVFTGNWSLEAAAYLLRDICASSPEGETPEQVLERLLDHSLFARQELACQQTYFVMLEALREFAQAELELHGELAEVCYQHASYYLQEVERAESGLRGMHQLRWMDHLTADYENICAALSWFARQAGAGVANAPATQQVDVPQVAISQPSPLLSRADALELALRLAAAFRPYWEWRGYLREGRFWFSQLLALPLPGDATPSLLAAHARVLTEASRLMWLQNRGDDAVALAEQSLALWRRLEDNPRGHALALLQRGWPAHGSGDFLLAKQCYQEGLDLLSPVTDPWFFAMLLIHLAAAAGFLNEFQLMRACYQQGQELFTRLGDQCSCADLLKDYGALLILEGSYGESIDRLLESLRLCSTLRHKQFQATGMFWLSFAVGMCGAPDPVSAALCAAQLRGVADELMQEIGMIHWAQALELTRRAEMSIRSVVTEQAWEEALASGRTLSVTQVLDLVAAWRREYVH